MISVDQALEKILSSAANCEAVTLPLLDAVGCVLAEEVFSDIDSPPHDKAMMDGYAIHADDLTGESVELQVIEEVTAGQVPQRELAATQATRIMTGAPVPVGAAAVVMVEWTELVDGESSEPSRVRVSTSGLQTGANILLRATSLAVGQSVLKPGTLIRPIEVGVLAEIGKTQVQVYGRPTVAVMTSGNELVTPDVLPGPGQIRNSNNPMLVALSHRAGAAVHDLGIARDEEGDIRRLVDEGLKHNVLILSGGVSAGVLDLVPKVLSDAGVREIFHKVNLKPGKPLWFGLWERDGRKTLVFGLPGNPVSSLVCFELFARAAIARMRGLQDTSLPQKRAQLTTPHQQRGDRPVYFPGVLTQEDETSLVTPLPWQGSADLSTLAQANCLIHFPAGERTYETDDSVAVYLQ